MAKAELVTQPTSASVDAFIDAIPHPSRKADAKVLREMVARLGGYPAVMWGPTIVGFGSYQYRYPSGHEFTLCRVGFSPRKANLVLYIMMTLDNLDPWLSRFGKFKTGASCIYVNKLADIELGVLEEMIVESLARLPAPRPA